MEVPLPEVKSRYNFSEPEELASELEENQNGPSSYSKKLALFVNSNKQELRERFRRFVRIGNENPDPYEQVWEASRDLIKRHWELAYQFEWEDINSEAQEVEGMKAELEQKFGDFEREMDSFREDTLYSCSCIMTFQKMMDLQQRLKQVVLKMYPLFLRDRDYNVISRVFEFGKRAAMINMPVEYGQDQRIFGDLRREILSMELGNIASIICKQDRACKRVRNNILPMRDFISKWNKWLRDEAYKFLMRMTLVKVTNEEWELLDYPFYEMFHSLSDLPQEYYALRRMRSSEDV